MSVKGKLYFSFVIAFSLFLLLASVGIYSLNLIDKNVSLISTKNTPQKNLINRSVLNIEKSISNLKTFVMSYDNSDILVSNIHNDLDNLTIYLDILQKGKQFENDYIQKLTGEDLKLVSQSIEKIKKLKLIISECVSVHNLKVDLHFEFYSKIYDVEIYFYRLTNKDYKINFYDWYNKNHVKNKKIKNYIDKYANAETNKEKEQYSAKIIKAAARTLDMIEASEKINFEILMKEAEDISQTLYQVKESINKELREAQQRNKELYDNTLSFYIITIILVGLAGILIATLLSKYITNSISILQNSLIRFFKFINNESKEVSLIDFKSNDEFGQMCDTLNKNIDVSTKLHKKIAQLLENIDKNIMTGEIDTNGNITNVSEAFCKKSGYSKEELIGKSQKLFIDELESKYSFENLLDTIEKGKVYEGEIKHKRKDGTSYWIDVIATPKYDQNGIINGYTTVKYDINTQKEIERTNLELERVVDNRTKELKELNSTLELKVEEETLKNIQKENILMRQSKFASIGEMLGNIAHQWRQPLSIVTMQAVNMRTDFELNDELTEDEVIYYHDSIVQQCQYLSQTIDDFRNFFTANDNLIETTNIKNTINKSISLVKDAFKDHNIEIVTSLVDCNAKINESSFIQALINIFNNAKDAISENNTDYECRFMFIDIKENNSNIIITIKDSGSGIKKESIDKIFDPYFTTKFNSKGTGIGLYMVHQIINEHLKGDITVSNKSYRYKDKEHKGAQFTIKLPLEV